MSGADYSGDGSGEAASRRSPATPGCRTQPHGQDLDQVMVGQGRYRHRQTFEKAYRVGHLIGRGGFGSVYAGVRLEDNRLVAIKHVARASVKLWCSADGASVPKEICLLRQAAGTPHVIRLLDWYERPDSFILILQRPSCYKDLFDFISERGALDEPTAQKFFKQVVSAVTALQQRNVLHRDIKDENILVNLKTNSCILIDFGSGCHTKQGPLREFEGTQLYAPPEWLQRGQYHGEQATVYSLGVLLYVMLCGDVPYQTPEQITAGQLVWRRGSLSPLSRSLVRDCLKLEPGERPDLAQLASHPWCRQQQPARAPRFSPATKKYSAYNNKDIS